MPDAQMVGPGPVLTAWRARFAGRRLPIAAPVDPGGPVVPGVNLPVHWIAWGWPAPFVGPLLAQAWIAQNENTALQSDGSALIGPGVLIGAAGKIFSFSSPGSLAMWVAITKARAIREVELAEAMTPENRAAWLLKKRAALEKAARNRINAAARQADPAIVAALVADAEFAAVKWAHYA